MSKETEAVETAIEKLTSKAVATLSAAEAMHFSQAAVNMAQVRVTLDSIKSYPRAPHKAVPSRHRGSDI